MKRQIALIYIPEEEMLRLFQQKISIGGLPVDTKIINTFPSYERKAFGLVVQSATFLLSEEGSQIPIVDYEFLPVKG